MKTIDTSDLYKRKCELEDLCDALQDARDELAEYKADNDGETSGDLEEAVTEAESQFGDDEAEELRELEELESEISDFRHGETMIPVDDFEEYAQELAEDIGAIDRNAVWPLTCIDWKQAAADLAQDYIEVSYQGTDYYVRA
jgi:hypothetical protein